MRQKKLHISARLLLLSVFLYIQVYLPYTSHVHIINGVRIVHAHPFPGGEDHAHDARSLAVIDIANHQPFIDTEYAAVPEAEEILLSSGKAVKVTVAAVSVSPHAPKHRGPPSFSAGCV